MDTFPKTIIKRQNVSQCLSDDELVIWFKQVKLRKVTKLRQISNHFLYIRDWIFKQFKTGIHPGQIQTISISSWSRYSTVVQTGNSNLVDVAIWFMTKFPPAFFQKLHPIFINYFQNKWGFPSLRPKIYFSFASGLRLASTGDIFETDIPFSAILSTNSSSKSAS